LSALAILLQLKAAPAQARSVYEAVAKKGPVAEVVFPSKNN
jgi:hypothetical protein